MKSLQLGHRRCYVRGGERMILGIVVLILYVLTYCTIKEQTLMRAEVTVLKEDIKAAQNKLNDLKPKVVSRAADEPVEYTVTAYCPCEECCGKTDGITASGARAYEGVTVAADQGIPFGTVLYIDGVGARVVQDRGGAIEGRHIDLYFEKHSDALAFGVKKCYVWRRQ